MQRKKVTMENQQLQKALNTLLVILALVMAHSIYRNVNVIDVAIKAWQFSSEKPIDYWARACEAQIGHAARRTSAWMRGLFSIPSEPLMAGPSQGPTAPLKIAQLPAKVWQPPATAVLLPPEPQAADPGPVSFASEMEQEKRHLEEERKERKEFARAVVASVKTATQAIRKLQEKRLRAEGSSYRLRSDGRKKN